MRLTYHGTPKSYFESLDPTGSYLPQDFKSDGFVHCTDGPEALSIILTMYYKDEPGEWLVLYIDVDLVTSPVRYEDPAEIFPHVYGPIDRQAVLAVKPIARAEDGTFMRPLPL